MAFRSGPRSGGSGGFRSRFPREMTKIKCSSCGKDAEVPFKPREGSPVYCRECFMKKKGITPRNEQHGSHDHSAHSSHGSHGHAKQESDESEEFEESED